jgi:hypothetical protein
MKFQPSEYNPLSKVLKVFQEEDYLTPEALQAFRGLMTLGGVVCENEDEVYSCLEELHKLGLLVIECETQNNKYVYKVKSNYGK